MLVCSEGLLQSGRSNPPMLHRFHGTCPLGSELGHTESKLLLVEGSCEDSLLADRQLAGQQVSALSGCCSLSRMPGAH